MKNKNKHRTRRITLLGIFTTIIILQTFVPFLGYVPIPPLNPTIIHITVIVAAITLGTKDGMLIGGIWGIIRMLKAYTIPASPLDFLLWTNPLIAIVPRVLIGLFSGWVYHSLMKNKAKDSFARIGTASIVGSLTNTILVLLFIYLLYGEEYASAGGIDYSQLGVVLGTIILTNGIAEAVSAAVITPFISKPLMKRKMN